MLVRNTNGQTKNVPKVREQQPTSPGLASPSSQSPRIPEKRDQSGKKQQGDHHRHHKHHHSASHHQQSPQQQQPQQPGPQTQQKQSRWPQTSSSSHKVTFSNPPTTSPRSSSPQCSTTASANATAPPPLTKWQKLFSAFKKNKATTGPTNQVEAYRLKHSHNCSNSILRAGISNMKGYKKTNQDRCTAFSYLEGDPELAFFAIYDGHGGTGVANYLKDHLHEFILDQQEYQEGNMEEAIVKAFLQVDDELRTYGSATELTGSTATAILIKHGDLYCANLGDTRAVACVMGVVKALSSDHNTANPKERERVYAMGGTIKENRVGGVLIPTRSFGDFLLKSEHDKPAWKQVISPVPQIQCFKLDPQWEFVVVGSDGVWDAMSNQELISFTRSQLSDYTTMAQKDKFVLSDLCEQILDMCCAKTLSGYVEVTLHPTEPIFKMKIIHLPAMLLDHANLQ